MYANTNYNMSISQATYINAVLLVKLSVCEFALFSNSPNLLLTKYRVYIYSILVIFEDRKFYRLLIAISLKMYIKFGQPKWIFVSQVWRMVRK